MRLQDHTSFNVRAETTRRLPGKRIPACFSSIRWNRLGHMKTHIKPHLFTLVLLFVFLASVIPGVLAGGPGDNTVPKEKPAVKEPAVAPAMVAEPKQAAPAKPKPAPAAPTIKTARALYEKGENDKAIQQVQLLLGKDAKDMAALELKGALLRRKKDHRGAVRLYDQMLKVDPGNKTAQYILCMLNLQLSRETKDASQSAGYLAQSVRYSGGSPELALEYVGRLCEAGDAAEALRTYESLPADQAVPTGLTLKVAAVCRDEKILNSAERHYSRVLDTEPANIDATLGLVGTLLDKGDEIPALAVTEAGLKQDPDNVALLEKKGAIEQSLNRRYDAIKTYVALLAVDPEHGGAASEMAKMLTEIGCVSLAQELVAENESRVQPQTRKLVDAKAAEAEARRQAASPLAEMPDPSLVALCYHDVTTELDDRPYAVSLNAFVEQIEYLRAREYTFLDAATLLAVKQGKASLPQKSVMLSFDGGYASFHANVVPVLDLYGYPALVAVCTSWMKDGPPEENRAALMTWEQVESTAGHDLFTVACFSDDLHRLVPMNPQDDTGPAAATRVYLTESSAYETQNDFLSRIAADLKASRNTLKDKLGATPQFLVWPLGAFNVDALKAAAQVGFNFSFGQEYGFAQDRQISAFPRWVVAGNPPLSQFISQFHAQGKSAGGSEQDTRGMTLDLDIVCDPASVISTAKNLDKAVERIADMAVNTVYVLAFSDPDSDGNVESVFFPNRHLPVAADLLSHTVERLQALGLNVCVSMPTLSIVLPDRSLTAQLRVMEAGGGTVISSTSWSKRLSPFGRNSATVMNEIYADLAAHVDADGIVFGADAFLTDKEDFNPAAVRKYNEVFAPDAFGPDTLSDDARLRWQQLKSKQLTRFTEMLMNSVRSYRPAARFARSLYAPALHFPESEAWLAQNYATALETYDQVVILAYPENEDISRPEAWMERLAGLAAKFPDGLRKTVFQIGTYDPKSSSWIREREVLHRINALARSGARHIVYDRDDYEVDRPRLIDMRKGMAVAERDMLEISAETSDRQ